MFELLAWAVIAAACILIPMYLVCRNAPFMDEDGNVRPDDE